MRAVGSLVSGAKAEQEQEQEQEPERTRVGRRLLLGTTVLCLIKSARVNRSDLIWDGAKSRVPEVQTEVPVLCSPRGAAVPVDNGWLIRGILLSGDSGPEGRAEKQQRARPGVVGGLELRERGACAGLRCKGAGSWELGAGGRPGAGQRSCSKICSNTFLALHT